MKGCFLRGSQEFAVAQRIPTKVLRLFDYVILEEWAERGRSAVVKENKHLAVRWSFQTARGKIQHRRDLVAGQVEPFDDLFYAGPRLEIFENRSDRHPCTTEDPRAAYLPGSVLWTDGTSRSGQAALDSGAAHSDSREFHFIDRWPR
jgi:hypothetical protein